MKHFLSVPASCRRVHVIFDGPTPGSMIRFLYAKEIKHRLSPDAGDRWGSDTGRFRSDG